MSREELIEKMCEVDCNSRNEQQWQRFRGDRQAWREGMAEALDVAVGELLGEIHVDGNEEWKQHAKVCKGDYGRCYLTANEFNEIMASRRSYYLKPKSDPAVEAAHQILLKDYTDASNGISRSHHLIAEQIVAAVRNADKGAN